MGEDEVASFDPLADDDRRPRTGRSELYHPVVLVGDVVDIQAKPQFLLEALGPIDVRDRCDQNFYFHIHDQYFFPFSIWSGCFLRQR